MTAGPGKIAPADRARHRRLRAGPAGPLRHRGGAGQRARRRPPTSASLAALVARYGRLDLLCLDELGYVHLDPRGAELLFQVLTERDERASIAVASNAPFSEWGQTFTDARLAAAVVDRLTFRAHIIETGSESYRLRISRGRQAAVRGSGVHVTDDLPAPEQRRPAATRDTATTSQAAAARNPTLPDGPGRPIGRRGISEHPAGVLPSAGTSIEPDESEVIT